MDHIARPQHRLIQNIDHLQDQFHHGQDFQKFTDPSPIQSHQLTIQEILFRHFKINHIFRNNQAILSATGFQTDILKSLSDWPKLSDSIVDWLRTPSSQRQFENPFETQSFDQSLFRVFLSYRGTRIDTVRNIIGEKSQ